MRTIPSLGQRGEGWVVLQLGGLAAVFLGGLVLAGSGPALLQAPAWIVGAAAIVAGLVLAMTALIRLRRVGSFAVVPHPPGDGDLVDTGPYRRIRHPIYAGLVLGALGWSVVRLSWPAVIATLILAVVLDLKRRREEAWLADQYDGYAAYRERTKAFVPGIY